MSYPTELCCRAGRALPLSSVAVHVGLSRLVLERGRSCNPAEFCCGAVVLTVGSNLVNPLLHLPVCPSFPILFPSPLTPSLPPLPPPSPPPNTQTILPPHSSPKSIGLSTLLLVFSNLLVFLLIYNYNLLTRLTGSKFRLLLMHMCSVNYSTSSGE